MTTTATQLHKTYNTLPEDTRDVVVALLNDALADGLDLFTQVKQAHWNVKGVNFIAIHELFDQVADDVREYVDLIAERAVQLGGTAVGTARDAAEHSSLDEYPHDITDSRDHVEAISQRLAAFGATVRKAIDAADAAGDADTADIFTEVSRGVDKWLWFVEAHNQ